MKNLTPVTREEKYLHAIATGEAANITPVTGEEKYLAAIASGDKLQKHPNTRKEYFLNEIVNSEQTNKTYILEPTEVDDYVSRETKELRWTKSEPISEILSSISESSIAQVNDKTYAFGMTNLDNGEHFFIFGDENSWFVISYVEGDGGAYRIDFNEPDGTYTVSIYTETDGSNDSETRFLTPVTREEKYLHAIATHGDVNLTPVTTEEILLDAYINDVTIAVNPKTRKEYFVALATGATIVGGKDGQKVPFPGIVDVGPIDAGGGDKV